MSVPKEPSFFCNSKLVHDIKSYERCFRAVEGHTSPPKIIGEATTAYMVDANAPGRIRAILGPNVRFIFILRNPVDRAISAYWHAFKLGDDLRPLDEVFCSDTEEEKEALRLERKLLKDAYSNGKIKVHRYVRRYDDPFWIFRYVSNSIYLKYLRRYLEYFSPDNFFFVITEELAERPKEVFEALAEFLRIDSALVPDNLGRVYNKTFVPRAEWWARLLQALNKYRSFQKIQLWFPMAGKAYRWAALTEKPEVDGEVKYRIAKVLSKGLADLSEFVGKDLMSLWRISEESKPNNNKNDFKASTG